MKIIGFEGGIRFREQFALTYGCAALTDGDNLINAVLRRQGTKISEWDELVKNGHVAELPEPIDLPEELQSAPCYVMIMRSDFAALINHHAIEKIGGVYSFWPGSGRTDEWVGMIGMIFPSHEKLTEVARSAAAHIRDLVSKDNASDPDVIALWQHASRVLDPWDGMSQEEWVKQFRERLDARREAVNHPTEG